MNRWLALLFLTVSAMCANAQTLDGVTYAPSGRGSPSGGGSSFPSLLDMASPFVGGLN